MPVSAAHPLTELCQRLSLVEPYARLMRPVPRRIEGTSFFPGGWGLNCTCGGAPLPRMPVGGVMVLGQDFHNVHGYERLLATGRERSEETWGPLRDVLGRAGIPLAECFFTNLIMGLRETDKPDGRSPAFDDPEFMRRCLLFLRYQLAAQRPRLVLTLGKQVPAALHNLAPELARWRNASTIKAIDAAGPLVRSTTIDLHDGPLQTTVATLTHPCRRRPNVIHRQYNGSTGDDAESALLADALDAAGLKSLHAA